MEEGELVVVLHQVKNETGDLKHCIAKTVWEKK